ncbi:MAG: hypothetical protein HOV80_17810 [Polyangiaceae bacterium]|nr:hypothetical protein [Polyangiaceae bacterium]
MTRAPSELDCEINEWIERCPHATCPEYVPGQPGRPLHMRQVCGRVAEDVFVRHGGVGQKTVARWLNMDQSGVSKVERRALRKVRRELARLGVS